MLVCKDFYLLAYVIAMQPIREDCRRRPAAPGEETPNVFIFDYKKTHISLKCESAFIRLFQQG